MISPSKHTSRHRSGVLSCRWMVGRSKAGRSRTRRWRAAYWPTRWGFRGDPGGETAPRACEAADLFDLTGLQKAMSERYGLTAEQTLDCLQHLYEMKVATYPRTDSKYITHDDVDGLKELLQPKYALGFLDQKPVEAIHDLYSAGGFDPMRCVADDKVQGHTAILPTRRLTYDVFQHDLTDMEREVITVILTRMWSACATGPCPRHGEGRSRVGRASCRRFHGTGSAVRFERRYRRDGLDRHRGHVANGRCGEEACESDTRLPGEGSSPPVRRPVSYGGRVRTAETVHGGHAAVRHGACEPFRRGQ